MESFITGEQFVGASSLMSSGLSTNGHCRGVSGRALMPFTDLNAQIGSVTVPCMPMLGSAKTLTTFAEHEIRLI